MFQSEGTLFFDDFIHTVVCVEVSFDLRKCHDRAICGPVRESENQQNIYEPAPPPLHIAEHQLCKDVENNIVYTYPNLPSRRNFCEIPMASWKVSCSWTYKYGTEMEVTASLHAATHGLLRLCNTIKTCISQNSQRKSLLHTAYSAIEASGITSVVSSTDWRKGGLTGSLEYHREHRTMYSTRW